MDTTPFARRRPWVLPLLVVASLSSSGSICGSDQRCGNGVREGTEACDGTDLATLTCPGGGATLDRGELRCSARCELDTSSCEHRCGDGTIDAAAGEECDGDALGTTTCESLGFARGTLSCGADCRFDRTHCGGGCGNDRRDPGEDCDGSDLLGRDCGSFGSGQGPGRGLACTDDCRWDMSDCETCGNGIRWGDEQCDGADFGDSSCSARGFDSGSLVCNADCTVDVSGCVGGCGNGVREDREQCDGAEFGDGVVVACRTDEVVVCDATCAPTCYLPPLPRHPDDPRVCGNGVVEGRWTIFPAEECDGEDFAGRSCLSEGFSSGEIRCNTRCIIDTSGCLGEPEDLECMPAERCDNGFDDDCDGEIDEDCLCGVDQTQRCYTGSRSSRGVGGCHDGIQTCTLEDTGWNGECVGEVLPGDEDCNGQDDDCNGRVDDTLPGIWDLTCSFFCPSGDTARLFETVTLDAAGLSRRGAVSDCTWTVECPLGGSCPQPAASDACATTLYADVQADLHVTVSFVDADGETQSCSWVLQVTSPGLRVELTWEAPMRQDVDLHLRQQAAPATPWFAMDDCYWQNCGATSTMRPAWGYAITPLEDCSAPPADSSWNYSALGGCPSPRLDVDDLVGPGPENITIDAPVHGERFRVMAHYFSGTLAAAATVRIYCDGELAAQIGPAVLTIPDPEIGDMWRVADIEWDTGGLRCQVVSLVGAGGGYDIQPGSSRSVY